LHTKNKFEIGILLGRVAGERPFIVGFIPTPELEGATKGWTDVDAAWVAQHARNITEMLPGGLGVVGIYAYGEGAEATKHTAAVVGILRRITRAQQAALVGLSATDDSSVGIHLQVCSKTKRNTARAFETEDLRAAGSPVTLKPSAVLRRLVTLRSSAEIDVTVPVAMAETPSVPAEAM